MDMGGIQMSSNSIPTEEDFARARAKMRERERGLSEVRSRIVERFQREGLHEAFVFYSQSNDLFVAYLFYQRNEQIEAAEKSGLSAKIRQAVLEDLEQVGRGKQDAIKVNFEFDSHENVEANFEGDYYLRLR